MSTINYDKNKDSTAILDQSFTQHLSFIMTRCGIDTHQFLKSKNITLAATPESAQELLYQAYNQNLFSGVSSTCADMNNKERYVLSSTNGSLTLANLDGKGYPIAIISGTYNNGHPKICLWESSKSFTRMKKNKRSEADLSNLYLAHSLKKQKKYPIGFLNDNDQINQFKLKGYKYIRPTDLLVWMVVDGYISWQKANACYKKLKKNNPQGVPKNKSFSDILNIIVSHNKSVDEKLQTCDFKKKQYLPIHKLGLSMPKSNILSEI